MADSSDTTRRGFPRREWRELVRLVLESVAAGMFVSLVLALAVFIASAQAYAAVPSPSGSGQGMLKLHDASGNHEAAPLLFTDVHMSVSGMIARVQVKQRFVNPTADWREGVYTFPLPENSAVDRLRMHIGERVIEGRIEERTDARRAYEHAKQQGRKTTLVEQERANLFTTNLANIAPAEEVVVAIEYQQTLSYDAGSFSLRFPMAVTPRYVPGAPLESMSASLGTADSPPQMLDADRITPPYVHPRDGWVNPVAITIDLNAGFPLSKLASAHHAAAIEERPGHRYRLTLTDNPIPANRDFELVWTPDVGSGPAAALFTETRGNKTYALLMALPPPVADLAVGRAPREVTYIIDTSGSMAGVPIVQARGALLMALERLQPGDRFNVIEFNSTTTPLFAAPVPVDETTLQRARGFVSGLIARGGTEMLPALKAALTGDLESNRTSSLMRQVIFLTDGAVGNEDEILRLIHRKIGDRRLFTIGIGPAPNGFFMSRAAQFGRGTYTFIGDVREVKDKMSALFRKLETPVLTDISVVWPGGVDVSPDLVPDLYADEPVVVMAAFATGSGNGNVAISGRRGDTAWGMLMPVTAGASEPGVGVLWARAKIESLLDAGRRGAPQEQTRAAVLDIALVHHLVSKYTSMVAVDVTASKPAHTAAMKSSLPHNVPEGLDYDAIMDGLPHTAMPAPLLLVAGDAMMGGLPRTATPAPLLIVAGFCALLLALALAALREPTLRIGRVH
ncbi:MAG: marine proteobacterial sortase target protein [Casimicrobiaceae bacterium]